MDFFFETELGNGYPTDGIQSWKRSIAIYDLRYLSLFSSFDKTILLTILYSPRKLEPNRKEVSKIYSSIMIHRELKNFFLLQITTDTIAFICYTSSRETTRATRSNTFRSSEICIFIEKVSAGVKYHRVKFVEILNLSSLYNIQASSEWNPSLFIHAI